MVTDLRPVEHPVVAPLPARVFPSGPQPAHFRAARWVWWSGQDGRSYNSWAWFRCRFTWDGKAPVELRLSADSRYRLWLNERFAGEGPVRGWPDAWYCDERDLNSGLRPGTNTVHVLVQHYGCNTFHTICQQAAFIAELRTGDGGIIAATGVSGWEAAEAPEYRASAPRIAVQLPAMEIYDARLAGRSSWAAPCLVERPAWSGLRARDVADAAISAHPIAHAPQARLVRRRSPLWAVPTLKLLHPSTRLVAVQMTRAFALAAELDCARPIQPDEWMLKGWELWINGQPHDSAAPSVLAPGRHRVLLVVRDLFSDWVDIALGFPSGEGVRWRDAFTGNESPAWRLLRNPDGKVAGDDLLWLSHNVRDLADARQSWKETGSRWGALTGERAHFAVLCQERGETMPDAELFFEDPDALFKERVPVDSLELASHPSGGWIIPPSEAGDVELMWDLGGQFCGYHELALDAPADVAVDLSLIEHVRAEGVLQHTDRNRNCLRYLTRSGAQRYTTRQRRSGRFLFLTVRGASGPVHLKSLVVRESRYPAETAVPFDCSDEKLTRVWRAAHRTMQLCTDDVFVDCPLYEQTLWVGDARNLQAYALAAYGARDVSRRSLRLAADSLRRLPMIGAQVPSGWDTIIPAWSFLWGMAVWEYYNHSGERDTLEEFWPAVTKNLRGAAAQLNAEMLFDAPWWNLFEWADLDCDRRVVLYNTLFFVGAVDAAVKCARVLDAHDDLPWLETLARRLRAAVARRFDAERGLFPDSLHPDGASLWARTGVHTQFLACRFDVATGDQARALLDRVERNASELIEMASPFAFQFWAEAFEKAGREDRVISGLRERFAPMVELGDTLWEALPGSKTSPPGYPTRSHCHGWSSCPMDFFPRILLGLRPTAPGGREWICSPQPHGLAWAKGGVSTPAGPLKVRWEIAGKECRLWVNAPAGVRVQLADNPWLRAAGLLLRDGSTQ